MKHKYSDRLTSSEQADIVDFFISSLQSQPKMDGNHVYRLRASGWPWTHLRGESPVQAVRNMMIELERSASELAKGE